MPKPKIDIDKLIAVTLIKIRDQKFRSYPDSPKRIREFLDNSYYFHELLALAIILKLNPNNTTGDYIDRREDYIEELYSYYDDHIKRLKWLKNLTPEYLELVEFTKETIKEIPAFAEDLGYSFLLKEKGIILALAYCYELKQYIDIVEEVTEYF